MKITYEIPDHVYKKFHALIYKYSGIYFNEINQSTLETKILNHSKALGYKDVQIYYDFVSRNRNELEILISDVTTNLTKFFRTPIHFTALKKLIISEIVQYKRKHNLEQCVHAWSAGCSTGEEPYSLAIWLTEYLPAEFKFQILATDISLPCLYKAQSARYTSEKCEDIDPRFLQKYFVRDSSVYTVVKAIRKCVVFDYSNLVASKQSSKFDIIFCRNVMIYFNKDSQKKLLNNLLQAMLPFNSYLFLGHTESLESVYNPSLPKCITHTPYITIYHKNRS